MNKLRFYRLLSVFLFGSLVISTLVCVILYNQCKEYYIELNQIRLSPLQLNEYPPEANPPKNGQRFKKRVVFFGDSRALAWPAPHLATYEFINRGIYGQTSVQVRQRFDQHIRPLKPDIVVVQVGMNDLKTIGLFPEKRQQIVKNCQENICEIAKEAHKLGAVVILTTIFPFGDIPPARKPFWSDDILSAVYEVNAHIASLADDKVIVFDTYSILADNRGMMPRKYRIDALHYNLLGYETLNQTFPEVVIQSAGKLGRKNR